LLIFVFFRLFDFQESYNLFIEAVARPNRSQELVFTLLSQSLVLGQWTSFLSLCEEANQLSSDYEDLFRELSVRGTAVPDMKVLKLLLQNERPKFNINPAALKYQRYHLTSTQLKLSDVTGDDVQQVQETRDLFGDFSDWKNVRSDHGTVLIQGALVIGVNLFPQSEFVFCGYFDAEARTIVIQKLEQSGELHRYELKYSTRENEKESWVGKLSIISPRGESGLNNNGFTSGIICEFSTKLQFQDFQF
jgi:hypothetical protein